MKLIFRLFASLYLLTLAFGVEAQRFVPHTFSAGIDMPGIVRSIASKDRNMGELQAATNIASHMVVLEYGFENVDRNGDSFDFNTRGSYFRAGIDFTLNPKNPDGHKIFTGFRYAQSNFKNSIDFESSSETFGNTPVSVSNNNLKGSWLEWTFGMKINLTDNIGMGYTMRYKFSPDIKGGETLSSFDLPGYGRARKDTNFGLSYYIFYKLKFRNTRNTEEEPAEEEQ